MNLNQIYSSEFIRIEIDQNYGYLQTTWLQQPSSDCFREHILRVVEVAISHQVNKALFDIRDRAYLEIADQNWVIQEILPLFSTRKLRLAYLISPLSLEAMDIYRIQKSVKSQDQLKGHVKVKSFLNKQMACNWLLKQSGMQ